MTELLKANCFADFTYYRRSRLLLAFLLVFLLLTALQSLPAFFGNSGVQSFNTLQQIFSDFSDYLLVFAAGLGLFIISSHLRNRSLKMVFTKPCSPAVWLLSAFLTAGAVSFILNCLCLGGVTVLSLIWHVPVRSGLLFVSIDTFIASLGLIAYLMLLAMLMHPAIAVAFALVFNAGTFYQMQFWAQAEIRSGSSSLFLIFLERFFHVLYILLPMVHAFDRQTEKIYVSLRVMPGEWKYLLYSLGYVLILSIFCYSLSLFALYRKKHI